ncbi:TIR domain-containing protein [Veillonella caviae]|uniref:TIR domain-containing protein n=1 Tax=Veillonella caviae TaxID=248316 RepID=UPI0023A8902E|nr:TIR domain-containing protein [Veillonella caviae]MCI5708638.1 TIR domain-containing protein [Veillonella caviae]MDY5715344.1 TIR domain-containing protein [Veillonella caviae]
MYNLFISHSWSYSSYYNDLVKLLDAAPGFCYKNYSVPKNDPIHNAYSDRALKEAIRDQMKYASCVLILAGVYATYSKWINIEIALAQEMGKKIIAIEYWGAERTSSIVKRCADKIVKWNTNSIINAIES